MGPRRSLRRPACARAQRGHRVAAGRVPGLRPRLRGQARGARHRGTAGGDPPLRADRDRIRADHELCRPALLPEHHRRAAGEVLRRHAGGADRDHHAARLLHAGAQPDRGCRPRPGGGRGRGAGALQAGPRPHPQDEALPALRRAGEVPARPVGGGGGGLEPALRRDDGGAPDPGRRRDAEPRGGARPPLRQRPGEAAGGGRGAGRDLRRPAAALRADHQHPRQGEGDRGPLAEVPDGADRAAPLERRGARGGGGAARRGGRGLSPALAPLLCAEGEVARARQAAGLGPQRAASARGRPEDRLGGGEGDGARRLRRLRSAHGGPGEAVLRAGLDRRRGEAGEGAGGLRASDGGGRAPLRAPQLPRQEPRRDDAGARARARGAPAAGGGAGGAPGLDAADAGRDGERLRRDADLPQAARRGEGPGRRGRSCSPRRSRT